MTFRLLFIILYVCRLFVNLSSADAQSSDPQCAPSFDWAFNSYGQSPCTIAAYLQGACKDGSLNSSPEKGSDPCQCSSVVYSLLSACASCQSQKYETWSSWTAKCSVVYETSFPRDVPAETTIPAWAYQNVTTRDMFNVTVAPHRPEHTDAFPKPKPTKFRPDIPSTPKHSSSILSTNKLPRPIPPFTQITTVISSMNPPPTHSSPIEGPAPTTPKTTGTPTVTPTGHPIRPTVPQVAPPVDDTSTQGTTPPTSQNTGIGSPTGPATHSQGPSEHRRPPEDGNSPTISPSSTPSPSLPHQTPKTTGSIIIRPTTTGHPSTKITKVSTSSSTPEEPSQGLVTNKVSTDTGTPKELVQTAATKSPSLSHTASISASNTTSLGPTAIHTSPKTESTPTSTISTNHSIVGQLSNSTLTGSSSSAIMAATATINATSSVTNSSTSNAPSSNTPASHSPIPQTPAYLTPTSAATTANSSISDDLPHVSVAKRGAIGGAVGGSLVMGLIVLYIAWRRRRRARMLAPSASYRLLYSSTTSASPRPMSQTASDRALSVNTNYQPMNVSTYSLQPLSPVSLPSALYNPSDVDSYPAAAESSDMYTTHGGNTDSGEPSPPDERRYHALMAGEEA